MSRPGSILSRILWMHAAALLATTLIVASAVYLFLDSTADRLQRQTLTAHAETLQRGLVRGGDGALYLRGEAADAIRGSGASFSYRVIDKGGRVVLGARRGARVDDAVPRDPGPSFFRQHSRRAVFSGLSVPVGQGGGLWIVVIQNLEHPDVIVDDIVQQFLLWGALLIALILAVLLAVDLLIVRRALRPVNAASSHVRTLDVHDLDVRLPDAEMPTEIRPLAVAVNQALDRVARGYGIQRDFIADAAHELRTPLAIARMRVDAVADAEVAAALRANLDQLGRIVGQLLDIADADNAPPIRDVVDLQALAMAAVQDMAPLAIRGGRSIAFDGGDGEMAVYGSARLITRALGALIENALHHTPPGASIIVGVHEDGTLSVADDGPGVAAEDRPHMLRRFWRKDRSGNAHSGLGLAIVAQVARVHRTMVDYAGTPGGGATFLIRFEPVRSSPTP
ncbi:sensor histidine kinase [Sphingomonas crocodyli]|uniref:histidine kinase n=1 Tax=Sphingomonas crocodyli TaxID=1979270 RepID=A0A437MA19_9SPHN|nr:ATP-binding protein [Sphingomonas crocodyli]RVT94468.1 HAMP domain-containing protein [Sphingomonas crocodyli]